MSEAIKLFGTVCPEGLSAVIGPLQVLFDRNKSGDCVRVAVDIDSDWGRPVSVDWEVHHTMREACEWAEAEVRRQLEVAVKAAGGRIEWDVR